MMRRSICGQTVRLFGQGRMLISCSTIPASGDFLSKEAPE